MAFWLNLGQIQKLNAKKFPETVALKDRSRAFTYPQMNQRVNRLAHSLSSLGLQKGDKVAVLLENSIEIVEVFLATAKTGIIIVPVNFRIVSPEVEYIVNNSDAKALIVHDQFIPIVEPIRVNLKNIQSQNYFVVGESHDGYQDYETFLAHPGLDIVTIATPSGAHLEPCVQAAKAGKHIICEKPLEVTLERVDRMIRACDANKVMLAGIFPRRFSDATAVFKKAVDSGRLGKITLADAYIKWYRTQEYYDSGDWRGTWLLDGGGALMNQSIHTIELRPGDRSVKNRMWSPR